MLSKIKKVKTEYSCIVPLEYLKMYLKWIEYIPKHWNIESILNKKVSLLNDEEKEILKVIQEENKYKDIFKKYISNKEVNVNIPSMVSSYMDRMSIDKYAQIKLTKDEIEYCENVILNCFGIEDVNEFISKLESKKNRNLLEDYILFELNKKLFRLGIDDLNRSIVENIKENRNEVNGYEKCLNTRNRF